MRRRSVGRPTSVTSLRCISSLLSSQRVGTERRPYRTARMTRGPLPRALGRRPDLQTACRRLGKYPRRTAPKQEKLGKR